MSLLVPLLWVLGQGLAAPPEGLSPSIRPALGDDPTARHTEADALTLTWNGGPARIWRVEGVSRILLADRTTSPHRLPPLPRGTRLQVETEDGRTGHTVAWAVWRPADVAAWAVDGGLRAPPTDLAATPGALWATTDGAGLARWDGQRWHHGGVRAGLPSSRLAALEVSGDQRFVAHDLGVSRITPDGTVTTWPLDGGARDLALYEDTLWVLSPEGLVTLAPGSGAPPERALRQSGCTHWLPTGPGEPPWAVCDAGLRAVPDLSRAALPAELRPVAWIERVDGAWVADPVQGLLRHTADGLVPWEGAPPDGRDRGVSLAARVGDGLVLADGAGRPWRLAPDGLAEILTPGDGLPPGPVQTLGPSELPRRAWIGTPRGVALLNAAGTATPLPHARLAEGVPVHAVVPHRRGVGLAHEGGLTWLGRHRPRGWDALAAAVGPEALDLVQGPAGDWWSLSPQAAFRLDRRGRLSRWDLHHRGRALATAGAEVMVATDHGLRWWVSGARMLGPASLAPAAALHTDRAGLVWALSDDRRTLTRLHPDLGPTTLPAPPDGPPLRGYAFGAGEVWLPLRGALVRWAPGRDGTREVVLPEGVGSVELVGLGPAGVVVVDDSDHAWWLGRAEPVPVPLPVPAATLHRVVVDDHGAWLLGATGATYLTAP